MAIQSDRAEAPTERRETPGSLFLAGASGWQPDNLLRGPTIEQSRTDSSQPHIPEARFDINNVTFLRRPAADADPGTPPRAAAESGSKPVFTAEMSSAFTVRRGEGPYQSVQRAFGDRFSHNERMQFCDVLKQQYSEDTGRDPKSPSVKSSMSDLKLGYQLVRADNWGKIAEKLEKAHPELLQKMTGGTPPDAAEGDTKPQRGRRAPAGSRERSPEIKPDDEPAEQDKAPRRPGGRHARRTRGVDRAAAPSERSEGPPTYEAGSVLSAAKQSVGEKLWTRHAGVTEHGNLGCAAAVSTVLRRAGAANVDEVGVAKLSVQLQGMGWEKRSFKDRQPGDVIIGLSGGHGHTGIVGENNATYDNSSGTGRWRQGDASYWTNRGFGKLYVLHKRPFGPADVFER